MTPTPPPPSRRHIAVLLLVGLVSFGAGIAVDSWADASVHGALDYGSRFVNLLFLMLSGAFVHAAGRGFRSRRRSPTPGP